MARNCPISDNCARPPRAEAEPLGDQLVRLEPRLTALALRFTRDRESARDVVQSAFEKVVHYGDGFEGRSLLSTWIHRIVTNEALMWLRAERRRKRGHFVDLEQESLALVDATPSAIERLLQRERTTRLQRGLAHLSRDERDVLENCSLAGLSYAEYGRRTATHPAAVKSRAYRARRRLSSLLQDP